MTRAHVETTIAMLKAPKPIVLLLPRFLRARCFLTNIVAERLAHPMKNCVDASRKRDGIMTDEFVNVKIIAKVAHVTTCGEDCDIEIATGPGGSPVLFGLGDRPEETRAESAHQWLHFWQCQLCNYNNIR